MKLEVIIEKSDNELWGRAEGKGNFMPVTAGGTAQQLLKNIKSLIEDYLEHEGKKDTAWNNFDPEKIVFDIHYDLRAFFHEHDYLNISAIAKRAAINPGLLRQYAAGVKYPSAEQAKKIERAVHQVANELKKVSLYAE